MPEILLESQQIGQQLLLTARHGIGLACPACHAGQHVGYAFDLGIAGQPVLLHHQTQSSVRIWGKLVQTRFDMAIDLCSELR